MKEDPADPRDLVMTEAEKAPPPDVTVPPAQRPQPPPDRGDIDPQLLVDVKALADRAGGLAKLRELIDVLTRLQR